MTQVHIDIQRIHPDAIEPYYEHPGDSGMDLYAVEDITIRPGCSELIPTGWKVAIPDGYEGQIRPKSGIALNHDVTVLNTPGTIDSGYRGQVCVILFNHSDATYHVTKGHKIAQLVICPVVRATLREVVLLDATARNDGGFGSTGLTLKDEEGRHHAI